MFHVMDPSLAWLKAEITQASHYRRAEQHEMAVSGRQAVLGDDASVLVLDS